MTPSQDTVAAAKCCRLCESPMTVSHYTWTTRVGHYVAEDVQHYWYCSRCDEYLITLDDHRQVERRAAYAALWGSEAGVQEVRFARKVLGLSVEMLAQHLDVPVSDVRRWDSTSKVPRYAVLALIAMLSNQDLSVGVRILAPVD